MLVLTRNQNDRVVIAGNVVVTVIEIRGSRVVLGFSAPPDVTIDRGEVDDDKRRGNPPMAATACTKSTAKPIKLDGRRLRGGLGDG